MLILTTAYSPTFTERRLYARNSAAEKKIFFFLFQNQKDQGEKADMLHVKQVLRSFINKSSHLLRECFAQY